jgi:anion-transporting  ArsA/GET3 family ATPase
MRLLGRGASPLFGVLQRITGVDLLADLSAFFMLLGDMTEDFSARAAAVEQLLKSDRTAFLIVTSAGSDAIDEAIWFRRTLERSGLPFAGAVVNRVHHDLLGDREPDELAATLAAELGASLGGRVLQNLHDYHLLARRDQRNIARLEHELGRGVGGDIISVPHFDDDVHDIDGLLAVQRYLFATTAEREQLLAQVVS